MRGLTAAAIVLAACLLSTAAGRGQGFQATGASRQGDDETTFLARDDLPWKSDNPGEQERQRLRVAWVKPALDDTGMLVLRGRLFVQAEGGKGRRPVDWVQGVRVVLARSPGDRPDWGKRHDDQDSTWADCVAEKGGRFEARFFLDRIRRTPGKAASLQVAVALGTKSGPVITFTNAGAVLPQTVGTIRIDGPRPLSRTLQLINAAPSIRQQGFDPVPLVRAVNHLRALGKERAIAALREFLAVAGDHPFAERDPANLDTSDPQCVFLIVRLLFEPAEKGGKLPRLSLGMKSPALPPEDEAGWPLYPLALQEDVPFLVSQCVLLHGVAPSPAEHVDWAEKHGQLRAKPLRPADDPLAAVERLWGSPRAAKLFGAGLPQQPWERYRTLLRIQGWRAVREVVRIKKASVPGERDDVC